MSGGYEKGRRARRSILMEVYAREQDGQKWPTARELGTMLGLHHSTVLEHINTLQDDGLLERDGYKLRLTDCARSMMDLEIGG